MNDKKLYECPEGCLNKDKKCQRCIEGDLFVPVIEVNVELRQVGSKSNPSYALPIDKKLLKASKINVKKKVNAVIRQ